MCPARLGPACQTDSDADPRGEATACVPRPELPRAARRPIRADTRAGASTPPPLTPPTSQPSCRVRAPPESGAAAGASDSESAEARAEPADAEPEPSGSSEYQEDMEDVFL